MGLGASFVNGSTISVKLGDKLNCSSNSYPTPTISLTNDGVAVSGNTVEMTTPGQHIVTCTATSTSPLCSGVSPQTISTTVNVIGMA